MKPRRAKLGTHVIEVRDGIGRPELRVDDIPMAYGVLASGQFFLRDYAYDRSDDLITLARKYLRYKEKSAKPRKPSRARGM